MTEVQKASNALPRPRWCWCCSYYASDLPTPDELIARLTDQPSPTAPPPAPLTRGNGGGPQVMRVEAPRFEAPAAAPPQPAPQALANPRTYAELVALAGDKRDLIVKHALETSLRPVSIGDARLEVALVRRALIRASSRRSRRGSKPGPAGSG